MSGCWNSTRPKRSSTKGKRASAGRSRRLKHSCIETSTTRKAIDMTVDPGERQGDILSRHAATPRPPSQEFPMPTVFSHPAPVLALAALLGGRVSTGCCSSASCAPFCRMPMSSASGSASAMPTFGTGGFPFPRVCPAHGLCHSGGPAVPARFTPHGIHRRPSGRLKPYPAGRNDQRRTWRSRVLALRPNPVLLRLAPYPGFAVRPQGAPVATGLSVMLSELRWVWAPCLAVIAAALFFGKNPMRAIPRK